MLFVPLEQSLFAQIETKTAAAGASLRQICHPDWASHLYSKASLIPFPIASFDAAKTARWTEMAAFFDAFFNFYLLDPKPK